VKFLSQPVYGTIVNYRVGVKTQKPKECLIKFPQINSASSAGQLVNKKVVWKQGKTKLSGKIFGVHGKRGIVKAKFRKGVPGQALATKIELIE
jgi:large subunit ribosomal protein L35Ae